VTEIITEAVSDLERRLYHATRRREEAEASSKQQASVTTATHEATKEAERVLREESRGGEARGEVIARFVEARAGERAASTKEIAAAQLVRDESSHVVLLKALQEDMMMPLCNLSRIALDVANVSDEIMASLILASQLRAEVSP